MYTKKMPTVEDLIQTLQANGNQDLADALQKAQEHRKIMMKSNNWRKRHGFPMKRKTSKRKQKLFSMLVYDEFHTLFSEETRAEYVNYMKKHMRRRQSQLFPPVGDERMLPIVSKPDGHAFLMALITAQAAVNNLTT